MGRYGTLFFSGEVAQLEAFKKTLTDPAEIAAVEKTIEVLKAKEKKSE